MNEITSFKTLVGTLYKKLNKASVYGKLSLKELYILEIVYNLMYDCPTCFNEKTKRKLTNLIIKLQHLDKDICIYRENRSCRELKHHTEEYLKIIVYKVNYFLYQNNLLEIYLY